MILQSMKPVKKKLFFINQLCLKNPLKLKINLHVHSFHKIGKEIYQLLFHFFVVLDQLIGEMPFATLWSSNSNLMNKLLKQYFHFR